MTIDDLVGYVKDQGSFSGSITTLTDQKIIDAANSELTALVTPALVMSRQGYFTDYEDQTIVSAQAKYPIPIRAIDSGTIAIKYVDSSGNELYALEQISARSVGRFTVTAYAQQFYFQQGHIVLSPTPNTATGSIRVYYDRRPGKLTSNVTAAGALGLTSSQNTAVGTVSSVAYASPNSTITLTVNHNGWPASGVIDVMSSLSPFQLRARGVTTTTAAAGTATILVTGIDLTTATYGPVIAGDFVTLQRTSYIPQIPQEWHELLLDLTIARVANRLGLYVHEQKMRESAAAKFPFLRNLAQPRAQQNPRRISAWTSYRQRY